MSSGKTIRLFQTAAWAPQPKQGPGETPGYVSRRQRPAPGRLPGNNPSRQRWCGPRTLKLWTPRLTLRTGEIRWTTTRWTAATQFLVSTRNSKPISLAILPVQ